MKQVQTRDYIKPQIVTYRSREVVESLGTAQSGFPSGQVAVDDAP